MTEGRCEARAWLAGKEFRCVKPAGHKAEVFFFGGQRQERPNHYFRKVESD